MLSTGGDLMHVLSDNSHKDGQAKTHTLPGHRKKMNLAKGTETFREIFGSEFKIYLLEELLCL